MHNIKQALFYNVGTENLAHTTLSSVTHQIPNRILSIDFTRNEEKLFIVQIKFYNI